MNCSQLLLRVPLRVAEGDGVGAAAGAGGGGAAVVGGGGGGAVVVGAVVGGVVVVGAAVVDVVVVGCSVVLVVTLATSSRPASRVAMALASTGSAASDRITEVARLVPTTASVAMIVQTLFRTVDMD
jgi:hypothetical protein